MYPSTDFLRKNIHVTFYQLTKEGLRIDYTLEGKLFHLMAEPEQATLLLVESGFLEDRVLKRVADHDVWVSYDGSTMMIFESFARLYGKDFSQYFALQCAIEHESRKFLKGVYNQYLATGN